MIFDSHAHYDDDAFDADRDELLQSLPQNGICGVINNAVDIETTVFSIKLAEKYSYIRATAGFHPQTADKALAGYIDSVARYVENPLVVAIGEIGLDYYYDNVSRETQLRVFEEQLALAKELDIPVVVHDRDAHKDTLDILKKYMVRGILHCFSGSVEMMREVMKLGMSISLGGAVTFKNAKHPVLVAQEVPLDRLLLETDAPYMTPVPFRGKRCDSRLISYTAQRIAEVRGMTADEILQITRDNTNQMFGLNF